MPKFIKSANLVNEYFEDKRNQFCFVGRSNAGKSSLINALANEAIAKTSSTPGKTRLVNFFDFNQYVLVDLPGYGYAKTNKTQTQTLTLMINEYLKWSKKLICVCQLCSIDVITDLDYQVSNELKQLQKKYHIHYLIFLTKSDKLKFGQIKNQVKKASDFFGVDENDIIPISNKTKDNIKKVQTILQAINTRNK